MSLSWQIIEKAPMALRTSVMKIYSYISNESHWPLNWNITYSIESRSRPSFQIGCGHFRKIQTTQVHPNRPVLLIMSPLPAQVPDQYSTATSRNRSLPLPLPQRKTLSILGINVGRRRIYSVLCDILRIYIIQNIHSIIVLCDIHRFYTMLNIHCILLVRDD